MRLEPSVLPIGLQRGGSSSPPALAQQQLLQRLPGRCFMGADLLPAQMAQDGELGNGAGADADAAGELRKGLDERRCWAGAEPPVEGSGEQGEAGKEGPVPCLRLMVMTRSMALC